MLRAFAMMVWLMEVLEICGSCHFGKSYLLPEQFVCGDIWSRRIEARAVQSPYKNKAPGAIGVVPQPSYMICGTERIIIGRLYCIED